MSLKKYVVISPRSTIVKNVIIAESGASLSGYTLIEVADGVACQPGVYYNNVNGQFYVDAGFTMIYPQFVEES